MIEFLEEEDEGDEENDDENEDGIYERQVGGRYFQNCLKIVKFAAPYYSKLGIFSQVTRS